MFCLCKPCFVHSTRFGFKAIEFPRSVFVNNRFDALLLTTQFEMMACESSKSRSFEFTTEEHGRPRTRQRTTSPEQAPQQTSKSTGTVLASRSMAHAPANTEVRLQGTPTEFTRPNARLVTSGDCSKSVKGSQITTGAVTNTIPATDSTQGRSQAADALTGSAGPRTVCSSMYGVTSARRNYALIRAAPQASGAGPSRAYPSRTSPSRAGPSHTIPSRTNPSRAGASPSTGPSIKPQTNRGLPTGLPGSPSRRIRLYMETELMVSARNEQQHLGANQADFVRILVENNNGQTVRHEWGTRATMGIYSRPNPPEIDDTNWYVAQSMAQVNWEYPCKAFPFRLSLQIT
jgi:hypothetical protein